MKTLAAILLSLLLMCASCALALSGSGYPAFDGGALPDGAFGARIDGESLLLTFDPDEEYSNRMDGSIQLSFYAYNADEDHLLELYLVLPEDLRPGDEGDMPFSALYLYESDKAGETVYFASRLGGQADPEGTQLRITLEHVAVGADAISASGTLDATLCAYQGELPTGKTMTIQDARFSFTLPLGTGAQSGEKAPETAAPGAAFSAATLPPAYAKA